MRAPRPCAALASQGLSSVAAFHRNVELKAHDPEPASTLAAALAFGAIDHGVLRQRDTYFAARRGRLKLREQEPGGAQLIAYERADEARARTSRYHLADVADPATLTAALDAALGIAVVVDKQRRLLMHDSVRIHLDDVRGLGTWVELEAVAVPGSDLTTEYANLARLRDALGLTDGRIVADGYAALLLARGGATERDQSAEGSAVDAPLTFDAGGLPG